jgi:hypothetical protein
VLNTSESLSNKLNLIPINEANKWFYFFEFDFRKEEAEILKEMKRLHLQYLFRKEISKPELCFVTLRHPDKRFKLFEKVLNDLPRFEIGYLDVYCCAKFEIQEIFRQLLELASKTSVNKIIFHDFLFDTEIFN